MRTVNTLGLLLDAAMSVKNKKVVFLIWGDGDELPALKKRVEVEKIDSVVFKGRVEKKYVPSITSRADLNIAHNTPSPLFRFGISFNKLFDYLAAGRPILCDFPCPYNPAVLYRAGIDVKVPNAQNVAAAIDQMSVMDENTRRRYCENARKCAKNYDFTVLTEKLANLLEV